MRFQNFYEQHIGDRRHPRFAVAVLLPTDLDEIIAPLRERFDPLYNLVASHLTLVFPFEAEWPLDELTGMIGEELAGQEEIKVELSSIGDFYPVAPVICWMAKENEALTQLHYRLYGRLGMAVPHREYLPHVTIAREISEHRVMFVKDEIVSYLPDESFTAGAVDLITPLPDQRWVSVRTFPLAVPE